MNMAIVATSPPPPHTSFPAKTKFNPNNLSTTPNFTQPKTPSIHLPPKKSPKNKPHKTPIEKSEQKPTYPSSFHLQNKHPHAIYKDIQRFARKNKLKEAFTILDYLEKLGIPVNATTFSAVIGACCRGKSLDYAKQIHAHVRINGMEGNEFLKTKIVQMYASCGSLEDAKRLFGGEGDDGGDGNESVYAWNALLRGNVVSGRRNYGDLLDTFGRMREAGVDMNVYSYSCMIKSFGGAVALRQGLKVHGLLIKNGFLGSEIVKTSLVDMYFKCGKIKLACKVFDEMPVRDVVVWGAMVAGFAHNRLPREAIKYVRWMVQEGVLPNSVVLTSVLPVIGEVGALKLGKEVHCYVFKRRSYSELPFLKSGLIDMYCKCGDMDAGRKVFYSSKDRNTVSWTALMSGYVSNEKPDQALRSIIWMQREGFRPDVVSVATVLPVCAELRALREGKEIHAYLLKSDFLPNVSLITSLIVMYSKCGILDYSRRLFNSLELRNVIAWTAFIDACAQNKRPYEALEVFRSMQLSKHRADKVTMSIVLGICDELRLLKLGKEVHAQILKKGIERIPLISAGLVKFYGRCRMIKKAKSVFDFYPIQSSLVLTALMVAYGDNSYVREALAAFDNIVGCDLLPHRNTFNGALVICNRAGLGDEACEIFQLMTQRYKFEASKEQCSLLAGLLRRLGRVQEAERYTHWKS